MCESVPDLLHDLLSCLTYLRRLSKVWSDLSASHGIFFMKTHFLCACKFTSLQAAPVKLQKFSGVLSSEHAVY